MARIKTKSDYILININHFNVIGATKPSAVIILDLGKQYLENITKKDNLSPKSLKDS